jgi:hypothetical protein
MAPPDRSSSSTWRQNSDLLVYGEKEGKRNKKRKERVM